MAQTFTAKEVKPSTGDKKPTFIITEDGSELSGFQEGLKTMPIGTVFDAETKISKGYINIVEYKIIKEGSGGLPPVRNNGAKVEDPKKLANIEAQKRADIIAQLWIAGKFDENSPEVKKLRDWLMNELVKPKPAKAEKKAPAPQAAKQPEEILFVTNAKELMAWAQSHGKQYTPSWVRKEANLGPNDPITDEMAVKIFQDIKETYNW